jgi:hypothetical protein
MFEPGHGKQTLNLTWGALYLWANVFNVVLLASSQSSCSVSNVSARARNRSDAITLISSGVEMPHWL